MNAACAKHANARFEESLADVDWIDVCVKPGCHIDAGSEVLVRYKTGGVGRLSCSVCGKRID